jgi:putative glutamine amidotransferase
MEKRFPVLGVCRGLQLIQTHLGGPLSRIPGEAHVAVQHDVDILTPRPGLRGRRKVNSFHRWGIQVSSLAKPLTAVALCPGGWVEAAACADAPVLGVMWHPERGHPTQSEDVELFRDFFGRSR